MINTSSIRSHQTQLPGQSLRGVKNTIAIASGKGGVGKSTVTVNLAAALAKTGARVGILDADIYGPSIPHMLGDNAPVQHEDGRYIPVDAHGIQAMSIGYLTEAGMPLIWRGPMLAKSMIQLLDKTKWDALDYLLIDLPPGTGDIQLSLVQKIPLTAAIIVTTPQTIATLDAEKALLMFKKTNIHVLGLIENMAHHTCTSCGHHSALFGEGGAKKLANTHGCDVLGSLPLDARIREDGDNGIPSADSQHTDLTNAFHDLACNTSRALNERPLNYADKLPPLHVESQE
jgi:ATP-binding protein involved in chromosome partitioning